MTEFVDTTVRDIDSRLAELKQEVGKLEAARAALPVAAPRSWPAAGLGLAPPAAERPSPRPPPRPARW